MVAVRCRSSTEGLGDFLDLAALAAGDRVDATNPDASGDASDFPESGPSREVPMKRLKLWQKLLLMAAAFMAPFANGR